MLFDRNLTVVSFYDKMDAAIITKGDDSYE